MIAHITLENGKVHNVEIPNGWYRLPKKGNHNTIKTTDLTYNPTTKKWDITNSDYNINMYYAVIRKKVKKCKAKTCEIYYNLKNHVVKIPAGYHEIDKNRNDVSCMTDLAYSYTSDEWQIPRLGSNGSRYIAIIRKDEGNKETKIPNSKNADMKKDKCTDELPIDINVGKVIKYKYKDANRNWFDLTIKYICREVSETEENFYEGIWNYKLVREDDNVVYKGVLEMQYDLVPDASCVMADIMTDMTHLSIGITKHQKDIIQ